MRRNASPTALTGHVVERRYLMTSEIRRRVDGKYLTFVLGNEEYGIDALRVQGILSMQPITPMPHAPHYLKGVATVRGQVAPMISARARLGMIEIEDTPETCIILASTGPTTCAGIIVDTVRDVIDITEVEIEDPPPISNYNGDVIGLAKTGDRVKILLDIDITLGEVAEYADNL